ncbi:YjzC family protein [Metabacillus sp. GX 13764]|nr:YjzC family protein [Metabacillus kandeliae]MCD7034087.1 YjzC family protein [Metabacillus kandeliae]
MADTHKTGEKAPQSGTYKVQNEDTEIQIQKGGQFPPSPSSGEAANYVKA